MASRYAIEAVFKLVDEFSNPFSKFEKRGNGIAKGLARDFNAADMKLRQMGKNVLSFGKTATVAGFGVLAAGLAVATNQYIAFEDAQYAAAAAFSDLDSRAPDFAGKVEEMGVAARKVAAVTEYNATQTADALATLARAGVASTNAIALLPGVADLATAAVVGIDDAVGMAVGALNTMGLMSDDPLQLAENMARVSDVMAYTADSANMSLTDVSEAIKNGGNFFRTANNDLDVFSASLTALANNSITGAEAGVHLRNIMTNLSAPTDKAAMALERMGIETTDSSGNLLSLSHIVGQFNGAMDGMGDAERNATLYNIFGKQNIAAVTALLNTGEKALNSYAASAGSSMGSAARKAEVMRMSLKNQIEVLKSGLTELGFKFVAAFKTRGSTALAGLIAAVEEFDVQKLVDFAVRAADVLGNIVKRVWDLKEIIIAVVAAWKLYQAAMIAAVAITRIMQTAEAVQKLMIATRSLANAQKGMNAVQALFNVLMTANPIGLIIVAIGAAVGVIVMLCKHQSAFLRGWQSVSEILSTVGTVIGFIVTGFNPLALVIGGVVLIVTTLLNNIENIKKAFTDGGIVAGLKVLGGTILSALYSPIQAVLELLGKIPGIGKPFKIAAEWVNTQRQMLETGGGTVQVTDPAADAAVSGVTSPAVPGAAGNAAEPVQPPVTAGERTAYSREESYSRAEMFIGVDKTLKYHVTGKAPGITVQTVRSGEYSPAL